MGLTSWLESWTLIFIFFFNVEGRKEEGGLPCPFLKTEEMP